MRQFAGKVAVITGGHAGIGRAAAIEFATQGAQVVVSARRQQEGHDVIAELNALGGDAVFITTDVSHEREVKAMIERTLATFDRLDGAFNNAGITPTRIHIGATVKLEKVGEGFSITMFGLDTEAAIPGMDDATFQRYALDAKQNCPVSKALAGTAIHLNAKLLS